MVNLNYVAYFKIYREFLGLYASISVLFVKDFTYNKHQIAALKNMK